MGCYKHKHRERLLTDVDEFTQLRASFKLSEGLRKLKYDNNRAVSGIKKNVFRI